MVVISPRVKTSLERLYTAVDAPKNKILELEVKSMSRNDVEQEIFDLTNELSANIEEIKRRAFNDGVRAALQKNAIVAGTETSVANAASVPQPAPQTNVIIESPAPAAPQTKRIVSEARASDEVAAKLALLNDKLDEVDGAIASIHEMQFDLQKTQEEVKREFAAKLSEFTVLNRETSDYVDSARSVASRMTEVSARLGDALEENARARAAPIEFPSLDAVSDKLSELETKIDFLGKKGASREMQEENSRLLVSQGIELSSLKTALKKQFKRVRRATKRLTKVSKELGEVESAVRRNRRKTTRKLRRVAVELDAKVNANKKAASKKVTAAAKKVTEVAKKARAAERKLAKRSKAKTKARKTAKKTRTAAKKANANRVSKKTVVTTRKKGEKVSVTINAA